MGCNSSTTASQPGPAGAGGKKGVLSGTIKYTYIDGGYGRADPLQQMWDYHGQPCEKIGVEVGKQGTTEFGTGMPQVAANIGGKTTNWGQMGAILRSFGIRYGYYNPKDWKTARYCDPIVDSYADVLATLTAFAYNEDQSKADELGAKYVGTCGKFNGLIEKGMAHHGGKFSAGNSVTISDFVLCSYFGNLVNNPNH